MLRFQSVQSVAPSFVSVLKYAPTQARAPKGSPEGGRFTKEQMAFLEAHGVQRQGTPAEEMKAKPLPKTMAEAEDRIRHEPNEHAFLFKDGQAVRALGSDDSHHIYLEGMTDADLKDAVLTHNHPSGFGLSNKDGVSAAARNMLEMRAVTATGTHSIRRTGTDWPSHFAEAISDQHGELMTELGMRLHDHDITVDEANTLHHVMMYKRLQKSIGGFIYSFEPHAS